jgi:hypothetical protein
MPPIEETVMMKQYLRYMKYLIKNKQIGTLNLMPNNNNLIKNEKNEELEKEIESLKQKLKQSEMEIEVLVNMIKKTKKNGVVDISGKTFGDAWTQTGSAPSSGNSDIVLENSLNENFPEKNENNLNNNNNSKHKLEQLSPQIELVEMPDLSFMTNSENSLTNLNSHSSSSLSYLLPSSSILSDKNLSISFFRDHYKHTISLHNLSEEIRSLVKVFIFFY